MRVVMPPDAALWLLLCIPACLALAAVGLAVIDDVRLARRDTACYAPANDPRVRPTGPPCAGFSASREAMVAEQPTPPPDGRRVEIDERHLAEWVRFGIAEAELRLGKEREFEKWLERNGRE